MDNQDLIPSSRIQWARLVLGAGSPFTIIVVLTLVGTGVCWFSLEQISSLTKTPTRYSMNLLVNTEGCDDQLMAVRGYIGSFDSSALYVSLLDEENNLVTDEECWVRKIVLDSNLPLNPAETPRGTRLIFLQGQDADVLQELAQEGLTTLSQYQQLDELTATLEGDQIAIIDQPESLEHGPQFSMRMEQIFVSTVGPRTQYSYEIEFSEHWQPASAGFNFVVPENVYTSFNIYSTQENLSSDDSEPQYKPLDSRLSFWTDEVSILRGSISDSGESASVDGHIQFGIENNDAESRRESGKRSILGRARHWHRAAGGGVRHSSRHRHTGADFKSRTCSQAHRVGRTMRVLRLCLDCIDGGLRRTAIE